MTVKRREMGLTGPPRRPMLPAMEEPVTPPACPWLPEVGEPLGFDRTRRHGRTRGAEFYLDALQLAQELWLAGKPAQAILQLNKAWMADLPAGDPVLDRFPPPYAALRWLLEASADGGRGFLGDPVRHFQHLASRMSGVDRERRAWRAWCCMHLSERVLAGRGMSRDGRQLAREGLWIPGRGRAIEALHRCGWAGEGDHAAAAFGPGF